MAMQLAERLYTQGFIRSYLQSANFLLYIYIYKIILIVFRLSLKCSLQIGYLLGLANPYGFLYCETGVGKTLCNEFFGIVFFFTHYGPSGNHACPLRGSDHKSD